MIDGTVGYVFSFDEDAIRRSAESVRGGMIGDLQPPPPGTFPSLGSCHLPGKFSGGELSGGACDKIPRGVFFSSICHPETFDSAMVLFTANPPHRPLSPSSEEAPKLLSEIFVPLNLPVKIFPRWRGDDQTPPPRTVQLFWIHNSERQLCRGIGCDVPPIPETDTCTPLPIIPEAHRPIYTPILLSHPLPKATEFPGADSHRVSQAAAPTRGNKIIIS